MGYFFTFQVFWMKIQTKLNRFRIKKLYCYIVSDLRFLLEIQAILPETSPFLFAQMAVLSSFFQMFIVYLGCITLHRALDQAFFFDHSLYTCLNFGSWKRPKNHVTITLESRSMISYCGCLFNAHCWNSLLHHNSFYFRHVFSAKLLAIQWNTISYNLAYTLCIFLLIFSLRKTL